MKSFTLNVESWHYKLASNWGYDPDIRDRDICAYTRRVVLGIVVTGILIAMAGLFTFGVSILLVHMVLSPWFYFTAGLAFDELSILGYVITLAILATVAIVQGVEKYKEYRWNKRNERRKLENSEDYVPPEPGFLKIAYRAWKDKFCARLDFVNADGTHFETRNETRERLNREWAAEREAWEIEVATQIAEDSTSEIETPLDQIEDDKQKPTTGDAP